MTFSLSYATHKGPSITALYNYAEFHGLFAFVLSVIMLSIIMLCVVAPFAKVERYGRPFFSQTVDSGKKKFYSTATDGG